VCAATGCGDIILYGGSANATSFTNLMDTWAFDGSAWSQLSPMTTIPGGLSAASAAPWNTGLLMTGGFSTDTWFWTGEDWTLAMPTTSPSKRFYAGLASLDHNVVLFGGLAEEATNDTWVWNGEWKELSPEHAPSARYMSVMVSFQGKIVLFGGSDANGNPLSDTWQFDGTDWKQAFGSASPPAPPPRVQAAAAVLNGALVMFGGDGEVSTLDDTWLWDGSSWSKDTELGQPNARYGATAATFNNQIVLFGGTDDAGDVYGDTWVYGACGWAPLDLPANQSPSPRFDAAMSAYP
jgi:N-acetylneuraminic acid mutarotase